eukprot:TRINITY_DN11061_c0_g2_i2.p1 TRINITY_DN11061_c0_g2~~TRINITY_DN11061_c0_g2_i2.p1  ORF type:complete len:133 (-),score=18.35 TRINITY_DN11061_c0_g2_i2:126-524(-)
MCIRDSFLDPEFKFDQFQAEGIFNSLACLNSTDIPLKVRIQMVLTQIPFKLWNVQRSLNQVIKKDQALDTLFNQVLPTVFNGPNDILTLANTKNVSECFPAIGETVNTNLTETGVRLGVTLEKIYKIQLKKE